QKPNSFYGWMGTIYVESALLGVRRLTDRTRRTISFVRLLDAIAGKPTALSRRRFVNLWPPGWRDRAEDQFDRLCSQKGVQHLPRRTITSDREKLSKGAAQLEGFANETVAHLAQRKVRKPPTFRELNDFID